MKVCETYTVSVSCNWLLNRHKNMVKHILSDPMEMPCIREIPKIPT